MESGPAPRKFIWSDQGDRAGLREYPGFDADAEKRWLGEAFAARLAQLAAAYGSEPTIKWGVRSWAE